MKKVWERRSHAFPPYYIPGYRVISCMYDELAIDSSLSLGAESSAPNDVLYGKFTVLLQFLQLKE